MYREKGAFRVWVGAHPFVMLSDPQAAEVLLTSNKHIEKAQSYELLHPWLGTGLLTRYQISVFTAFLSLYNYLASNQIAVQINILN